MFLGQSLADVLNVFPMALIRGMMLMVGVQFVRLVLALRRWPPYLVLLTAAVSVATNMAVVFLIGLAAVGALRWLSRRCVPSHNPLEA